MNDNDIIKALEFCESPTCECTSWCPMFYNGTNSKSDCRGELHKNALDLINRQRAEIEGLEKRLEEEKHALFEQQAYTAKLQAEIERLEGESNETFHKWEILAERTKDRYAELYEEAKEVVRAEAIKEFAERAKDVLDEPKTFGEWSAEIIVDCIDNLVKEMTEAQP